MSMYHRVGRPDHKGDTTLYSGDFQINELSTTILIIYILPRELYFLDSLHF